MRAPHSWAVFQTGRTEDYYASAFTLGRSLQMVQGHRTAQGHRAGVDVDVTPPTGGPVGHLPNPATLCDRSAQGSKS